MARSDIQTAWDRIEAFLAAHAPHVLATLRPGATDAEIRELETSVGTALPPAFVESLRRHDGQDDPSRMADLFNFNHLLSVRQIIDDRAMKLDLFDGWGEIEWLVPDKIKNVTWSPGWIPFTEADGDGYVLDLDPTERGTLGQIFYRLHDDNPTELTATSFAEFLSRIGEGLSNGDYEMNDGIPHVKGLL
jgi:cell wall assembly regulator SMI1